MSASDEDGGSPPPDDEPPADEEYVRAYAAGYEDGARNALREVVQHAARGHTPQEIRMLAEGRLVRLPEEVEMKRKGLLAPPRRTAWSSILRPAPSTPARPWAAPIGGPAPPVRLAAGQGLLVREQRPGRAVEILRGVARTFPRVVIVSLHPPEVPGLAPGRRIDLSPQGPTGADGTTVRTGLSELSGRLKEPTEAPGGALVYLDAIEYYVAEEGAETTIRAIHWLIGKVRSTGSALLVSCDTRSMAPTDGARLERAFSAVL